MKKLLPVLCLLFFVLGTVCLSNAAPVLDQSQIRVDTDGYTSIDHVWEQGVTPGLTGMLTGIDLYFVQTDPSRAQISIFLASGAPWQTPPGVSSFINFTPTSGVWNHIDLTSLNFTVASGSPFSVGLLGHYSPRGFGAPTFGISVNDTFHGGDAYPGGDLYLDGAQAFNSLGASYDLAFKTYVGASVPEPSSLLLIGSGLVSLAAYRKWFRKA